jgi:hypothetical protein
LAISTRRFMPPDSAMILESFLSHSDNCFSAPSRCGPGSGLPNRPRLKETVAHTVSKASVVSSCGTRPMAVARGAKVRHDVVAADGDGRRRRIDEAADDADQRRLAGAVRAQQREDFAAAMSR